MTRPDYVFVLGLPRTGTTLMRSLLNSSEYVGISMGESRFFGAPRFLGLAKREDFRDIWAREGDISTEPGLKKVVDYFYREEQNNFWGVIPEQVERAALVAALSETSEREGYLFELAMKLGAHNKPIGGEKTPAHIHYVSTLFEWFPNSKVIHMFRDPRAVYVSEKRKYETKKKLSLSGKIVRSTGLLYELYSSLDIILSWLAIIKLHHHYQQRYQDRYIWLRYEDLVAEPRPTLEQVCDFLEIDFIEAMLQQTVVNSSFVSQGEQVRGFDTNALERWRQNVHPVVERWFALWCKKQLLEFGYES